MSHQTVISWEKRNEQNTSGGKKGARRIGTPDGRERKKSTNPQTTQTVRTRPGYERRGDASKEGRESSGGLPNVT